jgi:membrane-associated protease RseP (regulator of RpoE activity)
MVWRAGRSVFRGFGPRLLAIRRGETEYRLSAIPFGGYVKMAGTSPVRGESIPNGFDSKPRWQRFTILLAGPVMNVAFALVLAIVGLWAGIEVPTPNGPEATAITGPSRCQRFRSRESDYDQHHRDSQDGWRADDRPAVTQPSDRTRGPGANRG